MRHTRSAMLGALLLLSLTLLAVPALAQDPYPPPPPPEFAVLGLVFAAGETGPLVAEGFVPGCPYTVIIVETGDVLATGTADAEGRIETEITIPEDTAPGRYTLRITCGDDVLEQAFTVRAAEAIGVPGPPRAVTPAPGLLARTGLDITGGMALGGALLALGGAAVYGARRAQRKTA